MHLFSWHLRIDAESLSGRTHQVSQFGWSLRSQFRILDGLNKNGMDGDRGEQQRKLVGGV